jgi:hypothetical protein
MDDSYYDVAQICLSGHVANSMARDYPTSNQPFCEKCGERTTTACPACNTNIRGHYHVPGVIGMFGYTAPAFCFKCGKPFPWTASALDAARELADILEGLSHEDRDELKKSLDDLVREGPRTAVEETRFKRVMRKAGAEGAGAMRSILTDIVSETVRKTLFGPGAA